ncbi:hypothetical protein J5X84_42690 [Streptosporangiaceae bacterium NEAU-GS5]|nr:hypothetical protein [Streptosporangiaceae bacterium NEAU-GS5]
MVIKVNIQLGVDELPALMDYLSSRDAEINVTTAGSEQDTRPDPSVLKPETLELLGARATPDTREMLTRFIAEEIRQRNAIDEPGSGQASYIRLYVPGPRKVGAYVYVRPTQGCVDLRLPRHYAEGCQAAYARDVKANDPYAIRVRLDSAKALEEAHRLAEQAARNALEA